VVGCVYMLPSRISLPNKVQVHSTIYPTLARIALDVLPVQASSVPCERLFSAGKEVADERCARLGAQRFEQLQMLKFEWRGTNMDYSAWNSSQVEDVRIDEYMEMLEAEVAHSHWDNDVETYVVD
jgi:hypothetical protein